jgi:nitrogenase-associated protein
MVEVIFFEKPGCINNTRQKKLLQAAGHKVIEKHLLEHPWTPQELRPFFGNKPVSDWFNRSNPRVKSGEIVAEQIDEDSALSMMIEEPLLIRRPLMEINGEYFIGFDTELLEEKIGLVPVEGNPDLETCPRTHSEHSCSDTNK